MTAKESTGDGRAAIDAPAIRHKAGHAVRVRRFATISGRETALAT